MLKLKDLEEFFKNRNIGSPIRISKTELIVDGKKMVKTHLTYLKNHPGNKRFMSDYERLVTLKKIHESYEFDENNRNNEQK